MNDKKSKLESQIKRFLAVRGHTPQNVDCEQVMLEMMEEINYWRMVAKHPGEVDRTRGGQKTAEMDRVKYQHMIGKAQSNISRACMNLVEKDKLIRLENGA